MTVDVTRLREDLGTFGRSLLELGGGARGLGGGAGLSRGVPERK